VTGYFGKVTVSRAEGPSGSYPAGDLTLDAIGGVASFNTLSITDSAPALRLRFAPQTLIPNVPQTSNLKP